MMIFLKFKSNFYVVLKFKVLQVSIKIYITEKKILNKNKEKQFEFFVSHFFLIIFS